MRSRIIMGVAAIALLLVGILAGMVISGGIPAFASRGAGSANSVASVSQSPTASPTGYCQLYVKTLATNLGIGEGKLESANSAALNTLINQMVNDGTLTSKQAGALKPYVNDPCSHLGQLAQLARSEYASWKHYLREARQSIATAVAKSLGISRQALFADLKAGQTIPQIASSHGVLISKVNSAYLGAVLGVLNQAENNGDLTQPQATAIYSRVTSAVHAGRYPLLGGWSKKATHSQATPSAGT